MNVGQLSSTLKRLEQSYLCGKPRVFVAAIQVLLLLSSNFPLSPSLPRFQRQSHSTAAAAAAAAAAAKSSSSSIAQLQSIKLSTDRPSPSQVIASSKPNSTNQQQSHSPLKSLDDGTHYNLDFENILNNLISTGSTKPGEQFAKLRNAHLAPPQISLTRTNIPKFQMSTDSRSLNNMRVLLRTLLVVGLIGELVLAGPTHKRIPIDQVGSSDLARLSDALAVAKSPFEPVTMSASFSNPNEDQLSSSYESKRLTTRAAQETSAETTVSPPTTTVSGEESTTNSSGASTDTETTEQTEQPTTIATTTTSTTTTPTPITTTTTSSEEPIASERPSSSSTTTTTTTTTAPTATEAELASSTDSSSETPSDQDSTTELNTENNNNNDRVGPASTVATIEIGSVSASTATSSLQQETSTSTEAPSGDKIADSESTTTSSTTTSTTTTSAPIVVTETTQSSKEVESESAKPTSLVEQDKPSSEAQPASEEAQTTTTTSTSTTTEIPAVEVSSSSSTTTTETASDQPATAITEQPATEKDSTVPSVSQPAEPAKPELEPEKAEKPEAAKPVLEPEQPTMEITTTSTTTTTTSTTTTSTTAKPEPSAESDAEDKSKPAKEEKQEQDCNHLPTYEPDEIQKVFREETTYKNGTIKGKFTYINFDQRYRLVHYTRLPYGPIKIDFVDDLGRPDQKDQRPPNRTRTVSGAVDRDSVLQLRNILPNSLFGFPFLNPSYKPVARPQVPATPTEPNPFYYSTDSIATPNLPSSPFVPLARPAAAAADQTPNDKTSQGASEAGNHLYTLYNIAAQTSGLGTEHVEHQQQKPTSSQSSSSFVSHQQHIIPLSAPINLPAFHQHQQQIFGMPQLSPFQHQEQQQQQQQQQTLISGHYSRPVFEYHSSGQLERTYSVPMTRPLGPFMFLDPQEAQARQQTLLSEYHQVEPTPHLKLRVKSSRNLGAGVKSGQMRSAPSDSQSSPQTNKQTQQRQRSGKQSSELRAPVNSRPIVYHVLSSRMQNNGQASLAPRASRHGDFSVVYDHES